MTNDELAARVRELEAKLGFAPVLPPADEDSKPN
jgi:hypothetical protein